jgi:hypothetical protein
MEPLVDSLLVQVLQGREKVSEEAAPQRLKLH